MSAFSSEDELHSRDHDSERLSHAHQEGWTASFVISTVNALQQVLKWRAQNPCSPTPCWLRCTAAVYGVLAAVPLAFFVAGISFFGENFDEMLNAGWILMLVSYLNHIMIPYDTHGHPLSPDVFLLGMVLVTALVSGALRADDPNGILPWLNLWYAFCFHVAWARLLPHPYGALLTYGTIPLFYACHRIRRPPTEICPLR
eukprot:Skav207693  [mRNA]  locus=scaffold3057:107117:112773:+ [translate_table: standard]